MSDCVPLNGNWEERKAAWKLGLIASFHLRAVRFVEPVERLPDLCQKTIKIIIIPTTASVALLGCLEEKNLCVCVCVLPYISYKEKL